jgi:hypothetical protein
LRTRFAAGKPSVGHYDHAATHIRLVLRLTAKLEESHISHRAGQMPITHHAFDIQIFNTYGMKPPGEICCQFMQGIISDIGYSGVNAADFSFGLQPIPGTSLLSAQASVGVVRSDGKS